MKRGTVSMRVALVLRSAEVQPLFRDLCIPQGVSILPPLPQVYMKKEIRLMPLPPLEGCQPLAQKGRKVVSSEAAEQLRRLCKNAQAPWAALPTACWVCTSRFDPGAGISGALVGPKVETKQQSTTVLPLLRNKQESRSSFGLGGFQAFQHASTAWK